MCQAERLNLVFTQRGTVKFSFYAKRRKRQGNAERASNHRVLPIYSATIQPFVLHAFPPLLDLVRLGGVGLVGEVGDDDEDDGDVVVGGAAAKDAVVEDAAAEDAIEEDATAKGSIVEDTSVEGTFVDGTVFTGVTGRGGLTGTL